MTDETKTMLKLIHARSAAYTIADELGLAGDFSKGEVRNRLYAFGQAVREVATQIDIALLEYKTPNKKPAA